MALVSSDFSIAGPSGNNEDCVLPLITCGRVSWAAIADGLGGLPKGELASSLAIGFLKEVVTDKPELEARRAIECVSTKIEQWAAKEIAPAKFATTITAVRIEDTTMNVGHVGDCRVYHLRGSGIQTRTVDQTELQALLDQGVLTQRQAIKYPRKNVLLSAIAPNRDFEIYENSFEFIPGDRVVLVSDGVYQHLTRSELRNLSLENRDLDLFINSIRDAVQNSEPTDDFSCVCIQCE